VDRNIWALHIGHLMISMNEIDWMTHMIRIDILQGKMTITWNKFTLAERLKKLISRLSDDDVEHKYLKSLLSEALSYCDMRNLVAHGTFALDTTTPFKCGELSKYILHSLKHTDPISENELKKITQRIIELSDLIAERHAYIRMRNENISVIEQS
jgi:hypothetical protein